MPFLNKMDLDHLAPLASAVGWYDKKPALQVPDGVVVFAVSDRGAVTAELVVGEEVMPLSKGDIARVLDPLSMAPPTLQAIFRSKLGASGSGGLGNASEIYVPFGEELKRHLDAIATRAVGKEIEVKEVLSDLGRSAIYARKLLPSTSVMASPLATEHPAVAEALWQVLSGFEALADALRASGLERRPEGEEKPKKEGEDDEEEDDGDDDEEADEGGGAS